MNLAWLKAQDFEVNIGSDEDYEDLIAEVLYQGEFVCLISQETGFDDLNIEIHPRADGQPWEFKLSDFEAAVAQAVKRLRELRRVE